MDIQRIKVMKKERDENDEIERRPQDFRESKHSVDYDLIRLVNSFLKRKSTESNRKMAVKRRPFPHLPALSHRQDCEWQETHVKIINKSTSYANEDNQ